MSRLGPRARTALAGVLALLAVGALVGAGVVGRAVLDDHARDSAGQDALAAGTQLAVNFTTLDYRTFDQDAARVVAGAGGTFRTEFSQQSTALKKVVTDNKSVTKGKVLEAALVDHDSDSARVLLVVDADVTNTGAATPVARHYRIQLDLTRSGDRWLGTDLQFVG